MPQPLRIQLSLHSCFSPSFFLFFLPGGRGLFVCGWRFSERCLGREGRGLSEETQHGRVRNYAAEESHVKVQYCENLRPVGENEKESNDNLGRSAGLMN